MTGKTAIVQRVGRFQLREELGRGAQATVWLAHDERLQRDVALKLMSAEADTLAVSQWLHEARAVSRLSHPHIVPVFEADEQDGHAYLVFELVRGPTLAEQLRKTGAMPAMAAIELMAAVLDALATAHAQGIVHRDLKPSNVLVDAAGRPRVMDFGIAARVADQPDGMIVGTPGYMSPEAARGEPPSAGMDVFAAGMMLAELLQGWPLLRERDPMRALQRVCEEDFALPDQVSCDDALRAVVRRALARDLSCRFASAQAMRDALQALTPASSAGPGEGSSATLDFLLRRMKHKSDFPTLSESVLRVQRIAVSDTESLGSLSEQILKDIALTNKLLRLVNTAHFSQAGGGKISTVSRAVALVGFAGIRNMALSLVLLEHMQDKVHAARLKDEFAVSLLAGQLASELGATARESEEAYLAALFQNLGRLLVEFYFPEEAMAIRELLRETGVTTREAASAEASSLRVLGIGFEALGIGVARSWGLPDSLQSAMRRVSDDKSIRAMERGTERQRWLASASNDLADCVLRFPSEAINGRWAVLVERYAKALQLPASAFKAALESARQKLQTLAPVLGLVRTSGAATQRLLTPSSAAATGALAAEASSEDQATLVMPKADIKAKLPDAADDPGGECQKFCV